MGVLTVPSSASGKSYLCKDCNRVLEASSFYWGKKGYRHSNSCKACYQLQRRPYQIKYMATIGREKQRSRYCSKKRSETTVKMYGITIHEYEKILEKQGGVCGICGSSDSKTKGVGRFCIDHDHQTGKIRGLLCSSCNRGIGLLGDSIDNLKNAIEYLRRNK